MGRQFRFYLLPSEIDAIVAKLRAEFEAQVIGDVSPQPHPTPISSHFEHVDPKQKSSHASGVHCYLTSSSNPELRMWYMGKRQLWAIDDDRSEVIQFSGCYFSGAVLDVGRFYYRAEMLLDMSIWQKRPEFVSWADKIFRATKRTLKYSPKLAAYIGEEAARWKRQGGIFGSIRPDGTVIDAGEP
jgi:hypothetical protein